MSNVTRLSIITMVAIMMCNAPALAQEHGGVTTIISTCTPINNFVDIGPQGPSTGDIYAFVDELFTTDHSQKLGEVFGRCNLIDPSKGCFECALIAAFEEGTVTMEMLLYNVPGVVSVGAITGGTGGLRGASGEVSVDLGSPCGPHTITITMRPNRLNLTARDPILATDPPIDGTAATRSTGNTPALTRLAVRQNSPNPFTGTTDLEVGLPSASDVEVSIYDVAGRKVRDVRLSGLAGGWQRLPFDGNDEDGRPLSSGVYFYKVRAGSEIVNGKMMITK